MGNCSRCGTPFEFIRSPRGIVVSLRCRCNRTPVDELMDERVVGEARVRFPPARRVA